MHIPPNHPFRILLISSENQSNTFEQAIKSVSLNTRVAVANDADRLEKLLNMQGTKLPHLIFLDLVDSIEHVYENFSKISRCSILNSIPIVVFTPLAPPEKAVESFSGNQVLFLRKRQTAELLATSIEGLLSLKWRKYLTEKIPAEIRDDKEKSRDHYPVISKRAADSNLNLAA